MNHKRAIKVKTAATQLESALEKYNKSTKKDDKEIYFLAVTKGMEVLIEYVWKELKRKVEEEGLEAVSPKDAVRQAAAIGLIKDPESWIELINARNLSVHDYFGVSDDAHAQLADKLLGLTKQIKGLR